MCDSTEALRAQMQAMIAFNFSLAHGMVARGVMEAVEMRAIIEAADDNLPANHHPLSTEILALLIQTISEP